MASVDLTTLSKVKDWLALKGADYDDILRRMITAFSSSAENYCSRSLMAAGQAEIRNGHGGVKMSTKNFPINTITSLLIDGRDVTGMFMHTGTSIIMLNGSFTRGNANVVINYNAGYVVAPPDIEQAIIEWIELRFKRRGSADMVSKALAGETTTYSQADMPAFVKTVLDQYQRLPI